MRKAFFAIAVVAVVVSILIVFVQLTDHKEVITNNNLTVKKFLTSRSIEVKNNPKANKVYPVVIVSSRPLEKTSPHDAIYSSGGPIYILFTANAPE